MTKLETHYEVFNSFGRHYQHVAFLHKNSGARDRDIWWARQATTAKCGNANQLEKDSNNKWKQKMEDFEEKTEVREVVFVIGIVHIVYCCHPYMIYM